MRFKGWRQLGVLLLGVAAMVWLVTVLPSGAHDDKPHAAKRDSEHIHAPVPADYATVKAPSHIWTDRAVLVRGEAIYKATCAVCHGNEGAGDGPDATWLGPKMGSFRDRAMVAEMSDAYWFWRVSEGGLAEPYESKGSVMPAYKDALSVEDRWAVIAYQHAQSEHAGPHIASEHPEMEAGPRPHPEPRGIGFGNQWVTRDHRWQPRGPWKWAVMRELPQLCREFNGIDFGHAHLAETLLRTQNPQAVETARLEVLTFFSSPSVPPDEEQVAPTFNRMAWEVAKTFDWAHLFHRSLYDLFASDQVTDKEAVYRKLLGDYLEKPEAITPHRLDHHGALWSFPESKSFRERFRTFNTQIWAYHWLQAAVYDVQLMGDVKQQQELMPKIIGFYHRYLRRPPEAWQYMPMMPEAAPEFARRFPEAAAIFDNLHMLHDNFDDILARPDLYPTNHTSESGDVGGVDPGETRSDSQTVWFGVRPLVLRPGLAQDPVQNRVHVGGEVANLPAQTHDDGQGESGQDGQVLLDLDQRGRGHRHGGAASGLPHPYYEGHSWTTNGK